MKEHHLELFYLLAQALHQHPEQTLMDHGSHLDLRQLRTKKDGAEP